MATTVCDSSGTAYWAPEVTSAVDWGTSTTTTIATSGLTFMDDSTRIVQLEARVDELEVHLETLIAILEKQKH
jgi:hypothetical protein